MIVGVNVPVVASVPDTRQEGPAPEEHPETFAGQKPISANVEALQFASVSVWLIT